VKGNRRHVRSGNRDPGFVESKVRIPMRNARKLAPRDANGEGARGRGTKRRGGPEESRRAKEEKGDEEGQRLLRTQSGAVARAPDRAGEREEGEEEWKGPEQQPGSSVRAASCERPTDDAAGS